jgi:hypothetical protein
MVKIKFEVYLPPWPTKMVGSLPDDFVKARDEINKCDMDLCVTWYNLPQRVVDS